MKNFVQPGNVCTVVSPSGGVVSGAGVMIGDLFGVAATSAPEGSEVEIAVVGVFDLAKVTGEGTALTAGGPAFWDSTAKRVTGVAAGNTPVGIALLAAGDSAVSARVRLNGVGGLVSAAALSALAATVADHEDRIAVLET